MADDMTQDFDANKLPEDPTAAQSESPAADESLAFQPPEQGADVVNGAADGEPASDAPAVAPEAESANTAAEGEGATQGAEDSGVTAEVLGTTPDAPVANDAPASEPSAAPSDAPAETAPGAAVEPEAEAAPQASAGDSVAPAADDTAVAADPVEVTDTATPSPLTDTAPEGASDAPVEHDNGGVTPDAFTGGSDTSTKTESGESPSTVGESTPAATENPAEGEAELPFNATGMAQLGAPGGQEDGAPVEHPVPAAVPRPIDPTTGEQLSEDDHKAVTGGESQDNLITRGDDFSNDAASGAPVEHPAPTPIPRPIDPSSGLPLSDEDHKTVTGGLEKGDSVDAPKSPVVENAKGGEVADAATDTVTSTTSTASQPTVMDGDYDDDDNVSGLIDESDAEGEDVSLSDVVDAIKGMVEHKFDAVMQRVKHLEHMLEKALRKKR